MSTNIFEKLHGEGIISNESLQKIKAAEHNKNISVYWELKTLLYLGVLLFSTGLGIVIYKNIDTIGHQFVLAFIALVSAFCFYYCYKNKLPFSTKKVEAPNAYFDYILLLGCLTFISFIGYIQFQYHVFGDRYGLVTFIPMLVLFFCAYYFDHLGILSLAITNLAAWAGIAVIPTKILKENNFDNPVVIITGLLLGAVLIVFAAVTKRRKLKPHFEFTYTNFGIHLTFISCLAAMFYFEHIYLVWMLALIAISYFFYRKAFAEKSFYYLLILTLYFYIGLSYVVIRLLFFNSVGEAGIYAACMYFIASGAGLIFFLVHMNKKIKSL